LVRASLETLGKSLDEAKAALTKAEEQIRIDEAARKLDRLSEARRRAVRVETVRLAMLKTRTILETDKVELQLLTEQATTIREAFERGAINRIDYINAQLRRDRVAQEITSNEKVLAESQEQLTRATEQMSQFSPEQTIEVAKLLSPVRAAIDVQESRIRELELQVKALEIRSPIDGTVVAIARWPGQPVKAGDPVATVAAEQAQYIVSYIRQQQHYQPAVGVAVDVRLRSNPTEAIGGVVDRVGPQVEPVPAHQLRDPRVAEWGLPVRIVLDGKKDLRPGELVDLRFHNDSEPAPPGGRRAIPADPANPPGT
jgi:multidrug resistance efflux pump